MNPPQHTHSLALLCMHGFPQVVFFCFLFLFRGMISGSIDEVHKLIDADVFLLLFLLPIFLLYA